MKLKPVKLQVALFLTAIDTSSKLKIAELVQINSDSNLNVDPFFVPSVRNTPDEIPIFIMQNTDTGWTFQISKERIDFIFEIKEEDEKTFEELFSLVTKIVISEWKSLSKEFFAKGNRIGLIGTFVNEMDNPIDFITKIYLKNEVTKDSIETQLHFLKKECIENININIWTRMIGVSKNKNLSSRLISEIDINTQPEFDYLVSDDSLNKFFNISYDLFKEKTTL